MLQVLAGQLKGMRIHSPEGNLLRPTKSNVRESLFNLLGQDLTGYTFIDLCAGTGSVGIEAISRNAKHVIFVELSRRVASYLERNLEEVSKRLSESPFEMHFESFQVFSKRGSRGDLVYFDPPYKLYHEKILEKANFGEFLNEDGLFIIEYAKSSLREAPQKLGDLVLVKSKKYGTSNLAFYKREVDLNPDSSKSD